MMRVFSAVLLSTVWQLTSHVGRVTNSKREKKQLFYVIPAKLNLNSQMLAIRTKLDTNPNHKARNSWLMWKIGYPLSNLDRLKKQ